MNSVGLVTRDLAKFFKEELENVSVTFNWPGPSMKMVYPALSLISVSNNLERWQPGFLTQETDAEGFHTFYQTGVWECRMDLHYFSKQTPGSRSQRDDQADMADKITNLMQHDFIEDESTSTGLTRHYGERRFENYSVSLTGYMFDVDASVQTGVRRSIFNLTLDIPEIVVNTDPIIEDPRIVNTEISEHVFIKRGEK